MLGLGPLLVRVNVGVGGISNLVSTLFVQRVTRRLRGASRTMVAPTLVGSNTPFLIALTPGESVTGFVALVAAQPPNLIHPLFDALTLRQPCRRR